MIIFWENGSDLN